MVRFLTLNTYSNVEIIIFVVFVHWINIPCVGSISLLRLLLQCPLFSLVEFLYSLVEFLFSLVEFLFSQVEFPLPLVKPALDEVDRVIRPWNKKVSNKKGVFHIYCLFHIWSLKVGAKYHIFTNCFFVTNILLLKISFNFSLFFYLFKEFLRKIKKLVFKLHYSKWCCITPRLQKQIYSYWFLA